MAPLDDLPDSLIGPATRALRALSRQPTNSAAFGLHSRPLLRELERAGYLRFREYAAGRLQIPRLHAVLTRPKTSARWRAR
jgi:hypothetical protein